MITGRPAKYTDPLTGKPYFNLAALQQLRKSEKLPFRDPGKDTESYERELLKRKPKWFTKFHAKRLEQNSEMKEQLDIMNNFMKGHGIDLKKPNPSKKEIEKFQDLIFNDDFLEAYSPAPVVHSLSQLGKYRDGLSFNFLLKLIEKYKNLMKTTKSQTSILWEEILTNKDVNKYFTDNVVIKTNDFASDPHPSKTPGLDMPMNEEDFEEEIEAEKQEENKVVEHLSRPEPEIKMSEIKNDQTSIQQCEDMKEFLHALRGDSSDEELEEEDEDLKSEDNDLISIDEDMKDDQEEIEDPEKLEEEEKSTEEEKDAEDTFKREQEHKESEGTGKRRQSARLRKL